MGWQEELRKSICTVKQLKKHIDLTSKEEKQLEHIVGMHPMRITRYYMSLIDKKDPSDPIRKMVIPSAQELSLSGSYDTSGEKESTKMDGLQHMYLQTALILATNRCAAYCRYCFRKRLVGLPTEEMLHRTHKAVKYIQKHKEINNVLISGGDSFILPTKMIKNLLDKLSAVGHLDFIRFGTKVPVTFPERILKDKELLDSLKANSQKTRRIYVVTQFNHPREITQKSIGAIASLMRANVVVNNQTVLLKGVNDDPQILAGLQKKLTSIGVNPYYVFQCRPVKRIKENFQLSLEKGCYIVKEAKKMLDGHSKRFKYVMSHQTGKIEIIGILEGDIYFKHHQAKSFKNIGKFFKRKLDKTAGWL
ncbi:MAG: KamA family radical SAM protein [Candidatus Omnitrophica bacterium]|nr:KamA family radical SAM protein [Candidatus Omnitrophota bacterium]MCF7878681.1 KamA family radical SAM protein [Candidatus Omnitrophota bacterium]MCF7893045.1 KamA family radical SAM protein [Candidatus Omnitrophota bacterium]